MLHMVKPSQILSFLLLILMFACGGSTTDNGQVVYYQYGSTELRGNVQALGVEYRPKDLSLKKIHQAGKDYLPPDIKTQNATFTFDIANQVVLAVTTMSFEMMEKGYPYFELMTSAPEIVLNNHPATASSVVDPDGLGQIFWTVEEELLAGATHQLTVTYQIPATRFSFVDGGVRFLTSMTDLNTANYFENWLPVTFEDDQFSLNLSLKLVGSTTSHQLFTNAEASQLSPGEWQLNFPSYFTKSSFYIHLTNNPALKVKEFSYQGVQKFIPVTVYSTREDLIEEAVSLLPGLFSEFENDFGPYAHDKFVAYINGSGGGMEFVGATITSIPALDHELFHSWFARSIMPADGRSGWIDEAFASWRDNSYFQAPALLSRAPTNLSAFSAFRKSTPSNCYRDGRQLIAELDRLFAEFGGMKPLMREFYRRYQNKVVTNEEFWDFLETSTLSNVDAYFERYTLNQAAGASPANAASENGTALLETESKHPPALTPEEILNLR